MKKIKTDDEVANASYYTLDQTSQRKVAKTIQVSERCNVDIDKDGFPVGVEVIY